MSDQNASSEPNASKPAADSGSTRKIILFGVLGVMMIALIFDYQVARPAVNDAYEAIANASMRANRNAQDFLSEKDVQELLGKTPAETFQDGEETVEVFHFTSGIPFRPHKLYSSYRKSGDGLMFSRHAKFTFDKTTDVVPQRAAPEDLAAEPEVTDDEYSDMLSRNALSGGGAPAGDGGEGDAGGPPERPALEDEPSEGSDESEAPATEETAEESTEETAEESSDESAEE